MSYPTDMFNYFKELLGLQYKSHPEAVIITCYYNPKNNPLRLAAFERFYETIKHLNHRVVECVTTGMQPQLPDNPSIERIYTSSNLWHKEQLLNRIIKQLPDCFKYVFWVDADILFSNNNWVVDAVEALQIIDLVQLFEYCVHLDKDEDKPSFDTECQRNKVSAMLQHRTMWKGYAANYAQNSPSYESQNYDIRGHVGFAWGARLETLRQIPLYDRALIGGADGIIAYAGTGQLYSLEVMKEMFAAVLEDVYAWGRQWNAVIGGRVGYISGDVYHLWHGKVEDRQYYKRIREFGPYMDQIREKDENGLYITSNSRARQYINNYYAMREYAELDDSDGADWIGAVEDLSYALIDAVDTTSSSIPDEMEDAVPLTPGDQPDVSTQAHDFGPGQPTYQDQLDIVNSTHADSPATQPSDSGSSNDSSADSQNYS